jgi:hypothetical protein
VTSNTLGFGLGEYAGGGVLLNTFEVTGGVITSFAFESFGSLDTSPDVTCCSLGLLTGAAALINDPNLIAFKFRRCAGDIHSR